VDDILTSLQINNVFAAMLARQGINLNGDPQLNKSLCRVVDLTEGAIPQLRADGVSQSLLKLPECAFNKRWFNDPCNWEQRDKFNMVISKDIVRQPDVASFLKENPLTNPVVPAFIHGKPNQDFATKLERPPAISPSLEAEINVNIGPEQTGEYTLNSLGLETET
jgi:hypothetical protein